MIYARSGIESYGRPYLHPVNRGKKGEKKKDAILLLIRHAVKICHLISRFSFNLYYYYYYFEYKKM